MNFKLTSKVPNFRILYQISNQQKFAIIFDFYELYLFSLFLNIAYMYIYHKYHKWRRSSFSDIRELTFVAFKGLGHSRLISKKGLTSKNFSGSKEKGIEVIFSRIY